MIDLREDKSMQNPYDYDLDLNERDDGDEVSNPSYNDYYMSYNNNKMDDAYAFPQWAHMHNKNVRTAAMEVINMHFYPEFLADYILTLWNGVDGALQDFYEGFTLRYNNNLKKSIAEELKKKGYVVYPVLVDDRAFYAKRLKSIVRCAQKSNNLKNKLRVAKHLFGSEALNLCIGEIDDIEEMSDIKVTASRAMSMLDYYKEIFPEDYAIILTENLIEPKPIQEDQYGVICNDFGISNNSLKEMENMLSGNRDPIDAPYSMGTDFGYDYIAKMRGYDGVKPEQYELTTASVKKKRIVAEDEIGNIPFSIAMDAINDASKSVSALLKENFAVPPVPIRQIRVQKNKAKNNFPEKEVIKPHNIIHVYEVWKITLQEHEEEIFVIISADCIMNRYNKTEWENTKYEGFFGTVDEALQSIESTAH